MPYKVGFETENDSENSRAAAGHKKCPVSRQKIKTFSSFLAINQALQPLQEFTDALSGERYVSVSYVKPVLHLMNTSILAAKEEDSDLTKSIKMKILEYMNTKYDNPATQELLDMTCFMDPRFKANYIISDKVSDIRARVMSEIEATVPQVNVNMTIISDKIMHHNHICLLYFSILGAKPK